jgi:tRNA(Ile)-lysidine synthase|tara:strand:- start:572 stop:1921 length:1350 start_codon:yes stop_codon:yes gene_type:complete
MKVNILNKTFIHFFEENNIDFLKNKFLLAVSGGVDSMVMFRLYKKNKITFSVCTCDFNLRGKESSDDISFVRNFCKVNGVKFYTKKFYTKKYALDNKISVQMAARKLRYEWFDQLIKEYKYSYLSTAHHNDDNLETILLNFIKTTGYRGLSGIPSINNFTIRPLLQTSKKSLKEYAINNNLDWREDKSNDDIKYQRNNLRKQVIPILKKINPSIEKSISNSSKRLNKVGNFIKSELEIFKNQYLSEKNQILTINIGEWVNNKNSDIIIYDILDNYGFNFFQAELILKTIRKNNLKEFLSEKYILYTERNEINIKPIDFNFKYYHIFNSSKDIVIDDLKFKIKKYDINKLLLNDRPTNAQIDYDKISYPLILRNFNQGERFIPLGMKKSKKISDYLSDKKISKIDKLKQCVISDSNNGIIWLIGHQINDFFKISKNTKTVLEFEIFLTKV